MEEKNKKNTKDVKKTTSRTTKTTKNTTKTTKVNSAKSRTRSSKKIDLELSKTQNIPITTKIITDDINEKEVKNTNKNAIIIALVIIISIILLVFISNKTFFRSKYTNKDFSIDIPILLYFKSDKNNVVTFKTLRKSARVKKYFDEYLSNLDNFDFYNCGDKVVYYNDQTKNAIYSVEVTKSFAIKTIKIRYEIKDKACN